jgi:hypothetical protein
LNKQPVAYPNKYVGAYCPLEKLEENMEDLFDGKKDNQRDD